MTKTLDEVIAVLEACIASDGYCDFCPYREVSCVQDSDVLYHLKMYRSDKLLWEADRREWYETWQEKLKGLDESRQKFIDKLKELEIGTLKERK